MQRISAILLGAGESKRMGRDKLLLPWGKKTVLEHSLQVLLASEVDEVIVVLAHPIKGIDGRLIKKGVKVVLNPEYRKGMSSSIRRGIQALSPKSGGILIAFGDMPLMKRRTINALIKVFRRTEGKIIVPSFNGRRGHPVIFPRNYERELLRLKGDKGGRIILEKHSEDVYVISVKSEGVVRDIDTWSDYIEVTKARCKCNRGLERIRPKGVSNGFE